ncbi:MAG: glycosyltransferase family 2 protein [Acidobacteriaceae bacterium]|nr:glycosyltransferase family 2 protein [Acidobacteriaceae bacterium]
MTLSVIVPLAPGEMAWRGLLDELSLALPDGAEVVLVSAGEPLARPDRWPDRLTFEIAISRPGRAVQMNHGAQRARGEWLWFLHADSQMSNDAVPKLLRFIARGEAALGWFDLAFLPDGPRLMWLNALGANLRSRWLGLPFGDQGFVLPASTFAALGGFDDTARAGEDHLFVWTARRAGIPLRRIDARLATSARKYRAHGWWTVTRLHLRLTATQARAARRNTMSDRA